MSFKYSVIIPHYNCEDGLERLLKSIPNKDTIEVIVVDDRSSTALFKDVINKSHLVNISGYINEGVKGAGAARNIGLEKAKGEFLIFADSDDFFTQSAFLFIDACIIKNPNSDVFFFRTRSSDANGDATTRHINTCNLVDGFLDDRNEVTEAKIRLSHYVPWGKVVKKEVVDKNNIKFDETIIANDGVFSLKVGKAAENIVACRSLIYCVTSSSGSLTRQKDKSKYRVRLEVYTRYFGLLTNKERKLISASPVPLLYLALDYGIKEFLLSVFFLKKNGVKIIKYYQPSKEQLKKIFSGNR